MKVINKFINNGIRKDTPPHEVERTHFMNGLAFTSGILLFVYSIINFTLRDYPFAIYEFTLVIFIIIAEVYLAKTGKTNIPIFIGLLVVAAMAFSNFMWGGFFKTGILWMYTLPLVTYFLAGVKKGTRWLLVIFTLLVLLYYMHVSEIFILPYDNFTIQMLLVTLAVTTFMVYLYEKSRTTSEENFINSLAETKLLYKIASLGSHCDNYETFFDRVSKIVAEEIKCEGIGVYLIQKGTNKVQIEFSRNIPEKLLKEIKTLTMDKYPYNKVFLDKEPLFIERYRKQYPQRSQLCEFKSIAYIPLTIRNNVFGALTIGCEEGDIFPQRKKRLIISLAYEFAQVLSGIRIEDELEKTNKGVEKVVSLMGKRELKRSQIKEEFESLRDRRENL